MNRLTSIVLCSLVAAVAILGVSVYSLGIGRASSSAQPSCEPASALPKGLTPLAASSDCVTDFTVLIDGSAVGGTANGELALTTPGGIVTVASGGTGAVTSLSQLRFGGGGGEGLVAYAVDEGIGVFNPQSASNLTLGIQQPLTDGAGRPLGASLPVTRNRFISMKPLPGRPHLNQLGQYALTKPDGTDEVAILDLGTAGSLCATYVPSPGDLPQRDLCNDVSAQLSPMAQPTPAPQALAFPGTGGGCSVSSSALVDAAHRIDVTIGSGSVEPNTVTINAGERYLVTLTLAPAEAHILHSLLLTNGTGQVVRDANDAILCLAAPNIAGSVSGDFVAPDEGGALYLTDPGHPGLRVKLMDQVTGGAGPTEAPGELATITAAAPPISAAATATPVLPKKTRTATPAPVAATPTP